MKPAPKKKPKRVRAIIVYTSPGYLSLRDETLSLEASLSASGRSIKSSHLELAEWGSGKRGSLLKNNKSNYAGINRSISLSDKNADNKLMRYINLGGKDRKNAR